LPPKAGSFPTRVFVGREIPAQSSPPPGGKPYPALAFAMLPALAYLITVPLNMARGPNLPAGDKALAVVQTLRCLANGFLISGLLWAAALAMILDGRFSRAAAYYLIAAVCTFLGILHSALPSEQIRLPWG